MFIFFPRDIDAERRQLIGETHNSIGLNVTSTVPYVRLSEASTQKRTRRRVAPTMQLDQPKVDNKLATITSSLPSPSILPAFLPTEPVVQQRCKYHRSSFSPFVSTLVCFSSVVRSRSLPTFPASTHGRQSRNDSGVVLTDELVPLQPISMFPTRRRIRSNQLVMHTSSHVCFPKMNNSNLPRNQSLSMNSRRVNLILLLLLFFSLMKIFVFSFQ